MNQKSEIKVYLPIKMIGELDRKKQAGQRSKFIEKAIREKIDRVSDFDIWDCEIRDVLDEAVVRLRRLERISRNEALVILMERVLQ